MTDSYTPIMEALEITDLVGEIMSHLDIKSIFSFSLANKLINSTLVGHIRRSFPTRNKGHPFQFHFRQMLALSLLNDNKMGITNICAPPSFGKTLIGLWRALGMIEENDNYCLILVPSKAVTTWLKEVNLFFPGKYERHNPEKSTFLVYDTSSHKKHVAYIRGHIATPNGLKGKVILSAMRNALVSTLTFTSSSLIVDEAQVGKWSGSCSIEVFKRPLILLTAENDYSFPHGDVRKYTFPFSTAMENELPTVKYEYDFIDPNSWMEPTKRIILANKKTVVFLANDKQMSHKSPLYAMFKQWCVDNEIKSYRFVKSTKAIDLFAKATNRSVLIANVWTATEGINMVGDAMVLFNPLCINPRRLFQCASRLVRTSNPYKKVSCMMMETSKQDQRNLTVFRMKLIVRSFTERCFISSSEVVIPYMYTSRYRTLQEEGYDVSQFTLADIYVLGTATSVKHYKSIMKNIRKKETRCDITIPDDILRKCIEFPFPI